MIKALIADQSLQIVMLPITVPQIAARSARCHQADSGVQQYAGLTTENLTLIVILRHMQTRFGLVQ